MRTYVRMMMGIGPHRPINELEKALARGQLDMAAAIAKDLQREHGRPIPLALGLRFLPSVAADRATYDAWACRWLARWLNEAGSPTIEQAAEAAGLLAELPTEPQALDGLLGLLH